MLNSRTIRLGMTTLLAFLMLVPAAFGWTRLGGDPLLPSIKGSGQTARNDFVKKSRTKKFQLAMRRAGLNAKQRKAINSAISRGMFKQCKLEYGDKFLRMAYGANGVFVDRNVTFKDPRYRSQGAPAFCLTVKIVQRKGNKVTVTTIKIEVPWKCVNFAIVKIVKKTTKKKTPAPKPTPTPTPVPPTPAPPTPVTPTPPAPPKVIVVPPPTPELPGPWVQADGSPAHLFTGGNAVIYFRTARGATLSVLALGEGWVSGLRDVPYMWNDTTKSAAPCPSDATCWEARLWSEKGATVGSYLSVLAIATLNSKEIATGYDVRIVPDDFGDGKKAATVAPDTYAVDVSEL